MPQSDFPQTPGGDSEEEPAEYIPTPLTREQQLRNRNAKQETNWRSVIPVIEQSKTTPFCQVEPLIVDPLDPPLTGPDIPVSSV